MKNTNKEKNTNKQVFFKAADLRQILGAETLNIGYYGVFIQAKPEVIEALKSKVKA